MKWENLTPAQRGLVIGSGAVLLVVLIAAAFALGRSGADEPELAAEPTATVTIEPTQPPEVPPADDEPAPMVPAPTTPDPEPTPPPAPPGRVFGQLKAIRDESGGAWSALRIDIDEAELLTGESALEWLTSQGEADFYTPAYWYAKNASPAVTTYPATPSPGPAVWMYTWPTAPAPGFYGPGMSKQVVEFGMFYDRIYMYGDDAGFLDRYYWFTLTEGRITLIEEQPRDPFYEP
jgi:hypothetical protein